MPVTRVEDDLLDANVRAHRVWQALQTQRPNPARLDLHQTAVIQGPFGSGKSTISFLVEEQAKESLGELSVFSRVNCWGFSSSAAQEHLLEQAIESLSKHVDCMALQGLPTTYTDAIRKTSSWASVLLSPLTHPQRPVHQLKRFTPILTAINGRLIIIIEDTDRNGPNFNQKDIEAMLFNFREVERVSFVLTTGKQSEIDFPKVAEHILFLPAIPSELTLTVLDRVRDHCRKICPSIDPTIGRNRIESLLASAQIYAQTGSLGRTAWVRALPSLIRTPRALKTISSSVISAWQILHGEVDLDDLIMLTALRHSAPSVFTFLGINFSDLKSLGAFSAEAERSEVKERVQDLKTKWSRVSDESGYDIEPLTAIVTELLPSAFHLTGVRNYTTLNRAQGLSSKRGQIYWTRLTNETLGAGLRDQEVLRAIQNAETNGDAAEISERIVTSSDFTALLLFFDDYTRCSDKVVMSAMRSGLVNIRASLPRGDIYDATSLDEFIRWLRRRDLSQRKWVEFLSTEITLCIPKCLRLANELSFKLSADGNLATLRKLIHELAQDRFSRMSGEEVATCFDDGFAYTLSHLMFLDRQSSSSTFLTQATDWTWFGPQLLVSMRSQPGVMSPKAIAAFGRWGPSETLPDSYGYDKPSVQAVFGRQSNEFYRLLAQPITPAVEDTRFRKVVELARDEAQYLLSALAEGSSTSKEADPALSS
jgi:hypothetical protein